MQPSTQKWVEHSKVSFEDVPHMLKWPLHPIKDLRGDISDLAMHHYHPSILQSLGITYAYMRSDLLMDDDWMKMLKYKPAEWARYLGFNNNDADDMGNFRALKVFGMDATMLKLAMHA